MAMWSTSQSVVPTSRNEGQALLHRSMSNPPERISVLAGSLESTENSGKVTVVVESETKVDRLEDPPVVIILRVDTTVPTTDFLGPDLADSLGDNRGT